MLYMHIDRISDIPVIDEDTTIKDTFMTFRNKEDDVTVTE